MRIFPAPTKASSGGPEGRAVFARPEHRSNRALTGQKLPGPRMIMMRVKAGCWSRQPSPAARRVAPAEAEPSAFRSRTLPRVGSRPRSFEKACSDLMHGFWAILASLLPCPGAASNWVRLDHGSLRPGSPHPVRRALRCARDGGNNENDADLARVQRVGRFTRCRDHLTFFLVPG